MSAHTSVRIRIPQQVVTQVARGNDGSKPLERSNASWAFRHVGTRAKGSRPLLWAFRLKSRPLCQWLPAVGSSSAPAHG